MITDAFPALHDAHATVIVTGGAGFIGSAVVRRLLRETAYRVVTLDALTYAGSVDTLASVMSHPRHEFVRGDIGDAALVARLFGQYQPTAVLHLAAETHVDRSIDDPSPFVTTNVNGTLTLLEAARRYHDRVRPHGRDFRFVHVSTDEVFGTLAFESPRFTVSSPYAPSSPYAASKASADHLVRAWGHTYGLPVIVTNCSNNYGPYQYPEKLIPLMILNALDGKPLPVYGEGRNVRDWLFVEDHASALHAVLERGQVGRTYLIGANTERHNLSVVEAICDLVDEVRGTTGTRRLITFVADRPGHDLRYAVDADDSRHALSWTPQTPFEHGLRDTVAWYVEHRAWCQRVMDGAYRRERLGLGGGS